MDTNNIKSIHFKENITTGKLSAELLWQPYKYKTDGLCTDGVC